MASSRRQGLADQQLRRENAELRYQYQDLLAKHKSKKKSNAELRSELEQVKGKLGREKIAAEAWRADWERVLELAREMDQINQKTLALLEVRGRVRSLARSWILLRGEDAGDANVKTEPDVRGGGAGSEDEDEVQVKSRPGFKSAGGRHSRLGGLGNGKHRDADSGVGVRLEMNNYGGGDGDERSSVAPAKRRLPF